MGRGWYLGPAGEGVNVDAPVCLCECAHVCACTCACMYTRVCILGQEQRIPLYPGAWKEEQNPGLVAGFVRGDFFRRKVI